MTDAELGCSKCRFSQRGCKRCRDPIFRARQQPRRQQRAAGARHAKKRQRRAEREVQQTRGLREAPGAASASSHQNSGHSAAAEEDQLQPVLPGDPSSEARDSLTEDSNAALDRRSMPQEGRDVAEAASMPEQTRDSSKPQHAPPPPPAAACAESQQPQQAPHVDEDQPHRVSPNAHAKLPEATTQGASSADTASESRPSFLSMLQSKMNKQRQKRRESQSQSASQSDGSLSDSSLSSVHQATPGKHAPPPSGGTGTSAPEALAAPRHKIAMQKRFAKRSSGKKASKTRAFAQPGQDPRRALWHPPPSPYGLIEEYLYEDPWKLLVACMLLNVTAGKQVRKVLWKLFEIWPTAAIAAEALPDTLAVVENLIQPLGLFRKRTMAIKRFSAEYLETEWVDPIQLHGIGQYASDAYFIFCRGLWQEVTPTDKDLLKYQQWLHSTNGEGTGLERDVMPPLSTTAAVTSPQNPS